MTSRRGCTGRMNDAPAFARIILSLALLGVFAPPYGAVSAETPSYPRIPRLASDDPVFSQYSDDVESARKALAGSGRNRSLPVGLYSYKAVEGDTLLTVAARCSVPYDSIASLNRIASQKEGIVGRILLLPSLPGLYLPDTARNGFERLLLSSFDPDDPAIISFTVREAGGDRPVHCIPDALFDGTVRAFFLTPTFRFPLPEGIQTSSFGYRKNPVTGNLIFHKGVDIAAPRGTRVLACADGVVQASEYDKIYGNYIILRHDDNRESLYGHLETKKIELHRRVKSGTIIGTVGSTGQSTGPHLHFEIHENGIPKNPAGFIKGN